MKVHLTKVSLALLSAAFLLGCQDIGSGAVGPDGFEPAFVKGGKPGGGGGKPGVVFEVDVVAGSFCSVSATSANTLLRVPGQPLGRTDKGGLFTRWQDGELRVTSTGGVFLDGNAQGNVQTHKGKIVDIDLQIRDRINEYDVYKIIDLLNGAKIRDPSPDGFTITVNRNVDIFGPAKGSKPGPSVGDICIGQLVYTPL